ncbi:MAG: diacylglycerol kinase family lipid kinase [Agathobacter sp.]|nr:diacylglycerol kinase family lipid kinase [Agathobacter sp.]
MSKKLLLIVNPVAGIRRGNNILLDIVSTFCEQGYECTTQITTLDTRATELVKRYGADKDTIVCVGGDGTFNETIAGCIELGIQPMIGYIPSGTTNDFASSLDLSLRPKIAVKNIAKRNIKTLDAGSFNGRVFAYTASFGIFTKAAYSTPTKQKNNLGYAAYILSGIKELGDIRSYKMKIETPNKTVEGNYIFGGICNSKRIGGMVQLPADVVDMNDGLLEAMFIKMPENPQEFMQVIFDLNTGNYESNMFDFLSVDKLTITSDEKIDWTLDGEYQKGDNIITVEVIKDAIKLCV